MFSPTVFCLFVLLFDELSLLVCELDLESGTRYDVLVVAGTSVGFPVETPETPWETITVGDIEPPDGLFHQIQIFLFSYSYFFMLPILL